MEAFIMGPNKFVSNYKLGVVDFAEFEDYHWPVRWTGSGLNSKEPLHQPVGTNRVGDSHYITCPRGAFVQNHDTTHTFDNTSPSTNDFVWYAFRHRAVLDADVSNTDDVSIMHFQDSILTQNTDWLAVTLEMASSGSPQTFDSFEYQVQKISANGDNPPALLAADLGGGALKTAATYGLGTWQWVAVAIEFKGQDSTTDKIYLYVEDSEIGTSHNGTGVNDIQANGGYMSLDSRTVTGKGATTMESNYSSLVANDDQGSGLITRPGAGESRPFYRSPYPRQGLV